MIAWYVFGGEVVPLAGPDSIFRMLLPMATIESTLTSFFGLLNGTQELRKKMKVKPALLWNRWFVSAAKYSLMQGMLGLLLFLAAMFTVRWLFPTTVLAPRLVPPIVGLTAGILGYLLHSRAVIKSETL